MGQNQERYVSGPQSIVSVPVASATVIYKGDFVCLDGGYAVPAGDMNDAGTAAANRLNACNNLLGIAVTASAAGETDDIQVDVSNEAVYELELQAAESLSFGAALEIYSDGDTPDDYRVVSGTTAEVAHTVEAITSGTAIRARFLPKPRLYQCAARS